MTIRFSLVVTRSDLRTVSVVAAGIDGLRLDASDSAAGERPDNEVSSLARDLHRRVQCLEELTGERVERHQAHSAAMESDPAAELEEATQLVDRVEERLRDYRDWTEDLSERVLRLEERRARLLHLQAIDLPLAELSEISRLAVVVALVDRDALETLAVPLLRRPLLVLALPPRRDERLVVAVTTPEHQAFLDRTLALLDPKRIRLDALGTTTPALELRAIEEERSRVEHDRQRLGEERKRTQAEIEQTIAEACSRLASVRVALQVMACFDVGQRFASASGEGSEEALEQFSSRLEEELSHGHSLVWFSEKNRSAGGTVA